MANSLTEFNDRYRFNQFLQAENPTEAKHRHKSSIISEILFYFVLALIVLLVLVFSATDNTGAPRRFLGYSGMIVLTGSMQSEIPQDSLIISKYVEPDTLKIGDDITFFRLDDAVVTHRVVAIYENYEESGKRGFGTKGVENKIADKEITTAGNVIGKVVFQNLTMGRILSLIKGNLLLCALIGALVIGLFAALRMVFSPRRRNEPKRQRKSRTAI